MAVKTSDEPNLPHDFDDDDDGPIIYKRYSSYKKNQLHSEIRNSSSHSQDGQISNVPSAQPSPVKPSVGISNATNSLINTSSMKLPVANPKSPSNSLIDHCAKDYCEDSEDDEDNKRFSVGLQNSNHDIKATPVVKKSSEDSDDDDDDDDVPLAKKLYRNSNFGTTSSNHGDLFQNKPIPKIQKEQQNGSGSSNKETVTVQIAEFSPTVAIKREKRVPGHFRDFIMG